MLALALLSLLPFHILYASAQEPVEAAFIRGHPSTDNGIWRADDFGGFYYDLDKDEGGEQLTINVTGRAAEKGHIVYSSRAWSRQFEYTGWGSYSAVAFFGQLCLAGYPASAFTDEVSSLGKGALRLVLIDEKDVHTLDYNSTLPLQDGLALAVREVSKDVAHLVVLKNGVPVYDAAVSIGGTLAYKVDDVPVLLVHLADAMSSASSGFAEVDGIFQVSSDPDFTIFESGKLLNMELTDLSSEGMAFQNEKALTLTRNSIIPLAGNLLIAVDDLPELRYYPEGMISEYGVHVIRGPAFGESSEIPVTMGEYNSSVAARWNSGNYTGFYYDPDKSLGFETLVLYGVHGRTVLPPSRPKIINNTAVQDGFQYTTLLQPKEFEFKPWGHYFVISFMGEQWFAGYDSSLEGQKASLSLLEHEQLGKVITDSEVHGNILAGSYPLDEGYEMLIPDVANDSIFVQLLKDGKPVDSSVVKSNSTYIYKKDLGDVKDMPIVMMHINNIFSDGRERFATIDGIFQISDQIVLPVDPGRGIAKLEIVATQPGGIFMVNPDTISLNRDSTVAIGPAMYLMIADNDSLRYYLYTLQYVVPRPRLAGIEYSKNVSASSRENFTMAVQAGDISSVTADIMESSTNRTVYSIDLTNLGVGSGDRWLFSWSWNATTLRLSDDGSPLMDAYGAAMPALLYLNNSTGPVQVSVLFDSSGRISRISSGKTLYYVSPRGYKDLNSTLSYEAVLANKTTRDQLIRIEPGKSILKLREFVNGQFVPERSNHTLTGDLEALEPHAERMPAQPGRYELRPRIENAVNALTISDAFYFNVTASKTVSLGSVRARAGETASVPLLVPAKEEKRQINISYDPVVVRATGVTGTCSPSWKADQTRGVLSVILPAGCGEANLSFTAEKENATTDLRVVDVTGMSPEGVTNGSITVLPGKAARKSSGPGSLAAMAALFIVALAARRRR